MGKFLGLFKVISGLSRYYKFEFLTIYIIFLIIGIIISFLFNIKQVFANYQDIKSGFIPNELYYTKKSIDIDSLIKKNNIDKSEILYGGLSTKKVSIGLGSGYTLQDQHIYNYKVYISDIDKLSVKYENKTTKLKLQRIKYSVRGKWDIYIDKLDIKKRAPILFGFNGMYIKALYIPYGKRAKISLDINRVDYIKFYNIFLSFTKQFIDINRLGIEQIYIKNTDNLELSSLRSKYDRAIVDILKAYIDPKYILASRELYDELSNYRKQALKIYIDSKKYFILDYINFPIEKVIKKDMDRFIISFIKDKNKDIQYNQYFLFNYSKIDNILDIQKITKYQLVPLLYKQKQLIDVVFVVLSGVFIVLVVILLLSLLNSFYKAFGIELYFFKTYGFDNKVFTLIVFVVSIFSLFSSYPILQYIYDSINVVFDRYFFAKIDFDYNLDTIFIIYMMLIIVSYIVEKRLFRSLIYKNKEEI